MDWEQHHRLLARSPTGSLRVFTAFNPKSAPPVLRAGQAMCLIISPDSVSAATCQSRSLLDTRSVKNVVASSTKQLFCPEGYDAIGIRFSRSEKNERSIADSIPWVGWDCQYFLLDINQPLSAPWPKAVGRRIGATNIPQIPLK